MKLDMDAAARSRTRSPQQIADAFDRVHRRATGQAPDMIYMSIPVDNERDADIIVTDAVHEIIAWRGEKASP